MPSLSIITINKNDATGLEHTLESIWCKQSFSSFEHIIIDGGSTDNSTDIIKRYESKLAYWVSEPDNGVYNAMNKGIIKAQGDYLLFLNSGDWLEEDILSKVFATSPTEDILFADLYYYYNSSKIVLKTQPDKLTLSYLLTHSLPHPSSFIRRKLFEGSLYNEKYRIISDWAFFVKQIIDSNRTTKHLNLATTYFNVYGMSSDSKGRDLIQQEKAVFFNNEFSPIMGESLQELHNSTLALEVMSRNKPQQLLNSIRIQRQARQCIKFLFFLNKFFHRQ